MKVKTHVKAGNNPFDPGSGCGSYYDEGYHDAAIVCSSNCDCSDGFNWY
jgi:hypothetical protein